MGIEMTIFVFPQHFQAATTEDQSQTRLWISYHVLDSALCNIFPKKSDRSRIHRRLESRVRSLSVEHFMR